VYCVYINQPLFNLFFDSVSAFVVPRIRTKRMVQRNNYTWREIGLSDYDYRTGNFYCYTDKKITFPSYVRKFRMEQLQIYI
jgi:hypothetical protein